MTSTDTKPTTTFWIITVLALLWNIIGVTAYIMQVTMTPEAIAALPENQRAMYTDVPAWATSAFALATWGALLANVMLLMRKKLAGPLFVASFFAILVSMYHSFFMTNMIEVSGAAGTLLPITIILIGAFMVIFTRRVAAKGWLT
jgi:hypothetical protein